VFATAATWAPGAAIDSAHFTSVAAKPVFMLPLVRELMMALGVRTVAKESLLFLMGQGRNLIMVSCTRAGNGRDCRRVVRRVLTRG
jgi:hypothetical protein